jgi:AcrR family transcriptional regulator
LLKETGYSKLSMEGIARKANVSKPAIYRRWNNLGLLVFEALFSDFTVLHVPDKGSIYNDLEYFLNLVSSRMNSIEAREGISGIISDMQRNAELQKILFNNWLEPVSLIFRDILSRAVKRNEIVKLDNPDLVLDLLVGTVFFRSLMLGFKLSNINIKELLDIVLNGISREKNLEGHSNE